MPTRTEAAQALAQAAIDVAGYWIDASRVSPTFGAHIQALRNALDAYSTATPDALPAEVARVVEAADAYERVWAKVHTGGPVVLGLAPALDALLAAVRAYRSSQPDPLPARLARLKPGSVVLGMYEGDPNKYTVLANHPQSKSIFVTWSDGQCAAAFDYSTFDRVVTAESP